MEMMRPRRTRRVAVFIAVALSAGAFSTVGTGQASASHVSCGDTITVDTTLDSDLVDCPDHGIVIGADDITLDLNGHLIDGDDVFGTCGDPECDDGVRNSGHHRVTVRDGSVRGFSGSAVLLSGRRNRLLGIASVGDLWVFGNRNVIARNRNFRGGIALLGRGNLIARSTFVRAPHDGILIFSDGGGDNILRQNRVRRSRRNGIWLNEAGSVLKRNVAVGSGDNGIVAKGRSTLTRNRAVRNGDLGIKAGLGAKDGGGNRAHGNGNPAQCEGVVCR